MAYVNPFSTTAPADTDLLSSGDDSIRTLAAALKERLLTIIVDVDASPMVLRNTAIPDGSIVLSKFDSSVHPLKRLTATKALVGAIVAGGVATGVVSIPGAVFGDQVVVGVDGDAGNGSNDALILKAYVSSADNLTYSAYNPLSGSAPTGFTLLFQIIKLA